MADVTAGQVVATGGVGATPEPLPLQAVDLTTALDLPGPVRGVAAFAAVLLLGVVVAWRFGPFLDRSIDASLERPLASLGYGVAANAVVAFGGVYLASQLAQVRAAGGSGAVVGFALGLLLVLLASALGFTVVGSTVVELWRGERTWAGPVVGAALAGGTAAVDPLVGGIAWFVLVSIGIGGPARRWLHASEGPDPSQLRRE